MLDVTWLRGRVAVWCCQYRVAHADEPLVVSWMRCVRWAMAVVVVGLVAVPGALAAGCPAGSALSSSTCVATFSYTGGLQTFTVPPGIDASRPSSVSPWPNCVLAGDWIQTGWPSTMESAARSGHLAAEAVCASAGVAGRFLVPDLKPRGLMRFVKAASSF